LADWTCLLAHCHTPLNITASLCLQLCTC
jgi:hypothetical protein